MPFFNNTRLRCGAFLLLAGIAAGAPIPKLGSINLHGVLDRQIPLGSFAERSPAGFEINLNHTLFVNFDGTTKSVWDCPELSSYCIRHFDGKTEWLPPGGEPVLFNKDGEAEGADGEASNRLSMTSQGSTEVEVHSEEGIVFSYHGGSLRSIEWGREKYSVTSNGSRILTIRDQSNTVLLDATYDGYERLTRLALGKNALSFSYDAEAMSLVTRDSDVLARFSYHDGLVSMIDCGGKIDRLEWRKISGACDRRLWNTDYSVELAADSDCNYQISRTSAQTEISARRKSDGAVSSLTYNSYNRAITERGFDGSCSTF